MSAEGGRTVAQRPNLNRRVIMKLRDPPRDFEKGTHEGEETRAKPTKKEAQNEPKSAAQKPKRQKHRAENARDQKQISKATREAAEAVRNSAAWRRQHSRGTSWYFNGFD